MNNFQIYIIGGFDTSGTPIDYMEVFDSQTKTMQKILDGQNAWIKVPVPGLIGYGFHTCAVPLKDKNAFVVLGGLITTNAARYTNRFHT
jgi:hypothetical protein